MNTFFALKHFVSNTSVRIPDFATNLDALSSARHNSYPEGDERVLQKATDRGQLVVHGNADAVIGYRRKLQREIARHTCKNEAMYNINSP